MEAQNSLTQHQLMLELLCEILRCDPLGLCSKKNLCRDVATLVARSAHEGISFLTKTLPKLGKALDLGMEESRFKLPREFHHSHKSRNIPAFCQDYFNRVFDEQGTLLTEADPAAICHLRQLLLCAYKLELECSVESKDSVIAAFVQTERELQSSTACDEKAIIETASHVAENVLRSFNPMDIVPRHGPGAVSTGEYLEEKWEFSRLYQDIHCIFPYYDYFVVGGGRELIDRLHWYRSLVRTRSGCAKVVLVPKDSRGPRLISCEPLEYQWIQQGLGRELVAHLEQFPLTRGHINFSDQDINRQLALSSSKTRKFATLDLKDASDRVSLKLVQGIFKRCPRLLKALEATRTIETRLPDGRIQPLSKFAPMGSSLCFPVEAFCFWALIVSSLVREHGLSLSRAATLVYVYGDDIVVPTEYAELSMQALESVDLVVNRSKSCIKGFFRESCGMDAFKGVPVTPLRLKTLWTGKRTDGSAYVSYVSFANQIAERGYGSVAARLWTEIEKVYGPVPYGTKTASYPCRWVQCPKRAGLLNATLFRKRWNARFQRLEFLLPKLKSRQVDSTLDGWPRLLRNLVVRQEGDPSVIVIPRSIQIKRGWTAAS